jgi:hypothetical protein
MDEKTKLRIMNTALSRTFKVGDKVRFTTEAKASSFDAGQGVYEVTGVIQRPVHGDLIKFSGWWLPICSALWLELV